MTELISSWASDFLFQLRLPHVAEEYENKAQNPTPCLSTVSGTIGGVVGTCWCAQQVQIVSKASIWNTIGPHVGHQLRVAADMLPTSGCDKADPSAGTVRGQAATQLIACTRKNSCSGHSSVGACPAIEKFS